MSFCCLKKRCSSVDSPTSSNICSWHSGKMSVFNLENNRSFSSPSPNVTSSVGYLYTFSESALKIKGKKTLITPKNDERTTILRTTCWRMLCEGFSIPGQLKVSPGPCKPYVGLNRLHCWTMSTTKSIRWPTRRGLVKLKNMIFDGRLSPSECHLIQNA